MGFLCRGAAAARAHSAMWKTKEFSILIKYLLGVFAQQRQNTKHWTQGQFNDEARVLFAFHFISTFFCCWRNSHLNCSSRGVPRQNFTLLTLDSSATHHQYAVHSIYTRARCTFIHLYINVCTSSSTSIEIFSAHHGFECNVMNDDTYPTNTTAQHRCFHMGRVYAHAIAIDIADTEGTLIRNARVANTVKWNKRKQV